MPDIQIASLFLSVATLLVTGYIAWQQWQISKNKLRLDLFDRRFAVFEAAMKLVSIAVQKGDVPTEDRVEFLKATKGTQFLFDQNLQDYCDALAKEAFNVQIGKEMMSTYPAGDQRAKSGAAWARADGMVQ